MGDCVVDLVETLFCIDAGEPEWALRIFDAWMEERQERISKASSFGVL